VGFEPACRANGAGRIEFIKISQDRHHFTRPHSGWTTAGRAVCRGGFSLKSDWCETSKIA